MIALNLVFYVYMVIQFGICEPSSGDPSLTQPPKVCLYSFEFVIASGAFNLVLDVLVLVLPIYAIWRLKLPIQRKLSTAAVFAIGTLYGSFCSSNNLTVLLTNLSGPVLQALYASTTALPFHPRWILPSRSLTSYGHLVSSAQARSSSHHSLSCRDSISI